MHCKAVSHGCANHDQVRVSTMCPQSVDIAGDEDPDPFVAVGIDGLQLRPYRLTTQECPQGAIVRQREQGKLTDGDRTCKGPTPLLSERIGQRRRHDPSRFSGTASILFGTCRTVQAGPWCGTPSQSGGSTLLATSRTIDVHNCIAPAITSGCLRNTVEQSQNLKVRRGPTVRRSGLLPRSCIAARSVSLHVWPGR